MARTPGKKPWRGVFLDLAPTTDTGQSSLPPPPSNRAIQVGVAIASWVMVATPMFATASVQDGLGVPPPIVRTHHEIARQSWDPVLVPYQPLKRAIPTQQIDNPPPSSDVNLTTILRSWDPPQQPYQPPRYAIPTQRIDAPPPSSRVTDDIILHSWDPSDPIRPMRLGVPQAPLVTSDAPPVRTWINTFISLKSWDPPSVSPFWSVASVQDGPTVTPPDNPPPNDRPWLDTVLHSWDASDPIRPRAPVVTASGPVVVLPQTPFTRPWLTTVLTSWEPLPPQPVWGLRIIDLTVPPIGERGDTLSGILASWEPPPPPPPRRPVVLASGPDVVVPNPPRTAPQLDVILHSWDATEPIRPRSPVVTASGPVFVPPYTRPWLDTVLHSWDPPAPILYRLPIVTPSGPDVVYPNPAFTRPWMDVIQHTWDEQNPIRPRPPVVTPSGPDVPQPPDVTGGATGRRRPGGKVSDYKAWPLPPPHFPTQEILTFGETPKTNLAPTWIKASQAKSKNKGTYRGLVYRPPVEPAPLAKPVVAKAPAPKIVQSATISIAVDTSAAQQTLAKRRRQEEEFIISFLMQHVL